MEPTIHQRNSVRRNRGLVWLAAAAAAAGIGISAAGIASAASTTPVTPMAPTGQASQIDPSSLPNGPGETVLTGTNASSVKAAVETAEPGATIIRMETDSGDHAYEAHVKLADGSVKTLYFTSSFAADGSDTGFGGGHGHGGPGQAPVAGGTVTG